MDAGKPGATNEGVLANFFNSLLSKKTGTGSPGSPASPKPGQYCIVYRNQQMIYWFS